MENEQAVISALLQDPSRYIDVRLLISDADFTDPKCAMMFRGIDSMGGKCDIVILSDWLRKNGFKDYVPALSEILDKAMPTFAVEYASAVKEASDKRKIGQIADEAKASTESVSDTLKDIEGKLISLYPKEHIGFRHGKEMMMDYVKRQAMLAEKGMDISGLPVGFRELDYAMDGMKPGELIILGARPSIGKTSLMISIADHVAVNLGKCVAIYSVESPETELLNKFISQRAKISTRRLRTGSVFKTDNQDFSDAIMAYSNSKICVNDVSMIDIFKIRAGLNRLIRSGFRPDLVCVDYLQILDTDNGHDNFAKKMGRVAQGLKNIAKELLIPVVCCAQINRANEERSPRLMDLKDSGDIEAIADMVLLLHREEFYHKDDCKEEKRGILEVDIAKNRNGQTGLFELLWSGEYTRITEKNVVGP